MTHIMQRRDYAATWTTVNPVLRLGEVGWERDTQKCKLGDGTSVWTALPYAMPGADGQPGDDGAPGIVMVVHGTDGTYPRPTAGIAHWVGSALPAHAEPYDFWTKVDI